MILTETPRRKRVTQLVSWGHWFALVNIVIAIIIASIYVFTSPLPGTLLGTLYLFSNWFSHIGFLTFVGFIIFILPLCYLIPNAKLVKASGSTIAAFGLALLAFDALLYNKTGLHLSLGSAELIRSETQTVIAEFGWQQWGFLLLLFVVWLSFQLIIANAIWKRSERLQKYRLGMPISSFFMLCFVSSHGVHVWADANLYQPIVQQDDMFPLSYPATAKTLMSKYDLLDLNNYQQRKALQFNRAVTSVNYPVAPVYCGIDNTSGGVLLIVNNKLDSTPDGLLQYGSHYSLQSTPQQVYASVLFGLPELYSDSLTNEVPLLLDLPSKLGMEVALYHDDSLKHAGSQAFTVSWSRFLSQLSSPEPLLAVGFVSEQQLTELLASGLAQRHPLLLTSQSPSDDTGLTRLLSNVKLGSGLSSHEDLAPTLLNQLGCAANVENYSTGQNLVEPRRQWLVSTQADKVIVLHNGHRIEVRSNGNHQTFERLSGEESLDPLNTGLLSQAMKTLSRFNK